MRSFEYLGQIALSLILLIVLTVLPLAPVLASELNVEETPEDTSTEVVVSDISGEEKVGEDFDTEEVVDETEQATDSGETISELEVQEELLDFDAETETDIDTQEVVEPETTLDGASHDTTSTESDDETSEDSVQVSTSTEEFIEEDITTTEDTLDDGVSEDSIDDEIIEEAVQVSTSTEEENIIAVNTVTNDDNRYSFSRDECTLVGDGSFYCSKTNDAAIAYSADRIFAATDGEGDKEIFIEHAGEITAFTENNVDDDAPYYDESSDSIVWHRLIDGRYQVMSRILEEDSEVQLTQTSYNNMEPSRYDKVTVWQSWIKNGWEIMLLDDGELTQLTDNDVPDIAPSINKQYIVWQSQEEGTWSAKVYDRSTGEIETIEDAEGLSIENARFVLVYDTKHENGDIETRGYDPKTKRSVPLSATPASIPEKLPEPDQTGEERALVQTVTQLKPKTGEDDPLPTGDPLDSDDLTDGATSTDLELGDVVLPSVDEDGMHIDDIQNTPTSTSELPLELVIEPLSATVTPTSNISDVVIPPFVAESSDSQEGIALDQ